jgi:benzoate membrane transport protein
MKNIEKGVGFQNVLSDFRRDISLKSLTNGLVAAIFTATFVLFFWTVLPNYGLDASVMDGWMTSTLYAMGVGSILLAAYFRKPIGMAGSFASWLCAMSLAAVYPQEELFAGCLVSGIILALLAYSGMMKKVLRFLPSPVVMGMIAGCFLSYGLYIVNPLKDSPFVVCLMVVAYLVSAKLSRRLPGVMASLIVAVVYYMIVGVEFPAVQLVARFPRFVMPAFTGDFPKIFISLTIPMTALVLGAENAQAYGVLETEQYDPPINFMTLVSGVGGILSAFTGTINVNIAGPLTAICASPDSGKK